jgi:O-antigen ligase
MKNQHAAKEVFSPHWLRIPSQYLFSLFLLLVLLTPQWHQGTFTHLPLLRLNSNEQHYTIGVLALLPFVAVLFFLLAHLLEQPREKWRWGHRYLSLPLGAFTLLALVRTWPIQDLKHAAKVFLAIGLLGGIYLYILQNLPTAYAVGTLAAMLPVQGIVGFLQFIKQHSLNLTFFGERWLTPTVKGASVIESGGQRWLRAYGLTMHPNILGGYLGIGMLICLGASLTVKGWRRWALWSCILVAIPGFLLSFSRSAWLGTSTGLLFLLVIIRPWERLEWRSSFNWKQWVLIGTIISFVLVLFLVLYGDLLASRLWRHDSKLERRSIRDRLVDLEQAWALFKMAPLTGVGPGRYQDALWGAAGDNPPPGFRRVHNLPLLASAELGVWGGVLWLWLGLALPTALLWQNRRARRKKHRNNITSEPNAKDPTESDLGKIGWAAALIAMTVISCLTLYFYIFPNWWHAVFLALLLGGWGDWERE